MYLDTRKFDGWEKDVRVAPPPSTITADTHVYIPIHTHMYTHSLPIYLFPSFDRHGDTYVNNDSSYKTNLLAHIISREIVCFLVRFASPVVVETQYFTVQNVSLWQKENYDFPMWSFSILVLFSFISFSFTYLQLFLLLS